MSSADLNDVESGRIHADDKFAAERQEGSTSALIVVAANDEWNSSPGKTAKALFVARYRTGSQYSGYSFQAQQIALISFVSARVAENEEPEEPEDE
jgi:hypothetical protein